MTSSLTQSAARLAAAAIAWAAIGIAPALAGDAETKAEATPMTAKECIADLDSSYAEHGKAFTFTMTFQNSCDRPIKCVIDAYVVGIRGPTSGHTTLRFPARGAEPARNSYVLKVKAMGGTAQYGRACDFI